MPTDHQNHAEREYSERLEMEYTAQLKQAYEAFCRDFPHRFAIRPEKIGLLWFGRIIPTKVEEWAELQGIEHDGWSTFHSETNFLNSEIGFKDKTAGVMAKIKFG